MKNWKGFELVTSVDTNMILSPQWMVDYNSSLYNYSINCSRADSSVIFDKSQLYKKQRQEAQIKIIEFRTKYIEYFI